MNTNEVQLNNLLEDGFLNKDMYSRLLKYIENGKNIVVVGENDSGKTTNKHFKTLSIIKSEDVSNGDMGDIIITATKYVIKSEDVSNGDIIIMTQYSDSRKMSSISEVVGISDGNVFLKNIF